MVRPNKDLVIPDKLPRRRDESMTVVDFASIRRFIIDTTVQAEEARLAEEEALIEPLW